MSAKVVPQPAQRAALAARLQAVRGSFTLDAEIGVEPGSLLGVIGANGSGKSTLLGALAGTLGITAGEVRLGERVLCSNSSNSNEGAVVSVPRASRRVGLLDQRARLFPHLSARENIAFGPRAQGMPRPQALTLADEWLERIDLPGRGDAREIELSGGQQQRVAIARTLAADPELLLLDEPFAALDVTSTAELRTLLATEVRRLGVPTILVTHDPVDLIALADRVVVFERGRIGQRGLVAEVLGAPATPFAAEFAGRALLVGVTSARNTLLFAGAPVPELRGDNALPQPGREVVASYDPAEVRLRRHVSTGEADPFRKADAVVSWVGTVAEVRASPTGVRITCAEWPEFFADMSVARALELEPVVGDRLELSLPHSALSIATPLASTG